LAEATPPIAKILRSGVKVSAGTDTTRVASYSPWVALAWRVTGKTVAGMQLYPRRNCLDRETALRMWTENVTWFSNEEGKKGRIQVGQFADMIVPDRDYFSCPEDEIADTTSDLTIVGGKIVYGAGEFARHDASAPPPAMPEWSPVCTFGGYGECADYERPHRRDQRSREDESLTLKEIDHEGCSRRPLAQLSALPSNPRSTHHAIPRSGDRMTGEIVRPLFSTPPAVR
jgi:hypothetical protein